MLNCNRLVASTLSTINVDVVTKLLFVSVCVSVSPTNAPAGLVFVVNAEVPFPIITPVSDVAPVPPNATPIVPPFHTLPVENVLLVRVCALVTNATVSAVFTKSGIVRTADPVCDELRVNTLVVPSSIWLVVLVAVTVVNLPVDAVVAPIDALLIVPPEIVAVFMVGEVSVTVDNVPPFIVGEVKVLLVKVSVVALPTKVSVVVGRVSVPVLVIVEITGALLKVLTPAKV